VCARRAKTKDIEGEFMYIFKYMFVSRYVCDMCVSVCICVYMCVYVCITCGTCRSSGSGRTSEWVGLYI